VSGQRRYDDGDLAWIGVISCLREAGLGIADLQRFTRLLHSEADATSRVAFLRDRRAELVGHIAAMNTALGVLDDKIAYYSTTEASA
jgi:DNA-binding transcriptional MerR regulator